MTLKHYQHKLISREYLPVQYRGWTEFWPVLNQKVNFHISEKSLFGIHVLKTFLAQSAPERYKMGMIEDVDDYRKQLKAYNAEAVGMGIG